MLISADLDEEPRAGTHSDSDMRRLHPLNDPDNTVTQVQGNDSDRVALRHLVPDLSQQVEQVYDNVGIPPSS